MILIWKATHIRFIWREIVNVANMEIWRNLSYYYVFTENQNSCYFIRLFQIPPPTCQCCYFLQLGHHYSILEIKNGFWLVFNLRLNGITRWKKIAQKVGVNIMIHTKLSVHLSYLCTYMYYIYYISYICLSETKLAWISWYILNYQYTYHILVLIIYNISYICLSETDLA